MCIYEYFWVLCLFKVTYGSLWLLMAETDKKNWLNMDQITKMAKTGFKMAKFGQKGLK